MIPALLDPPQNASLARCPTPVLAALGPYPHFPHIITLFSLISPLLAPQSLLGGDSNISARGEEYARHLPDLLIDRLPLVRILRGGGRGLQKPHALVSLFADI